MGAFMSVVKMLAWCLSSWIVVYSISAMAGPQELVNSPTYQPSPRVDNRGFIDVWQLQKDVIAVDSLYATDDTDDCYYEGDPEYTPTPEQQAREQQEEQACERKTMQAYKIYEEARTAFNQAWRPLLLQAIRKGDPVAEVIMLQCDTTTSLDRVGLVSTCARDAGRRAKAAQRLKQIGFVPAIDSRREIIDDKGNPGPQRRFNQLAALNLIRHGALGVNKFNVNRGGNYAKNGADIKIYQRWALIKSAMEDAPDAFTVWPRYSTLSLNRKPSTPGVLTVGFALHRRGDSRLQGLDNWRISTSRIYAFSNTHPSRVTISGKKVSSFVQAHDKLLAEIKTNIKNYLAEDPRWGVFLLHRVGFHEWVPEGMHSTTNQLGPAWEGTWELEKESGTWYVEKMNKRSGKAIIRRDGEFMRMSVSADQDSEPFPNAKNCLLRYSGGQTVRPGTEATDTLIGYNPLGRFVDKTIHLETAAPFDPAQRYKQVLMQCDEGESYTSTRVRFLLRANDMLVEFGKFSPAEPEYHVRIYRRSTGDTMEATKQEKSEPAPPAPELHAGVIFRDNLGNGEKGPEMVVLPGEKLAMGRYEVTQGEWHTIMGHDRAYEFSTHGFKYCWDACPVGYVSWNAAQKFIKKLNARTGEHYRLPTVLEWKSACLAGRKTEYCGSNDMKSVAWNGGNSEKKLHRVGLKAANGWGLYDMSGNIWEWTADCWKDDCGQRRVLGGSWLDIDMKVDSFKNIKLDVAKPNVPNVGFRLVMDLQKKQHTAQKGPVTTGKAQTNRQVVEPVTANRVDTKALPAGTVFRDILGNGQQGPAMVVLPGKTLALGKYEVTFDEWQAIMGNDRSVFTAHFKECKVNCPVEYVSWNDVQEYIRKLNALTGEHYRLPTVKEWEKACLAGKRTNFCGSNDVNSVAWYRKNSHSTIHPVGLKAANAWGLYDMSGNVMEWTASCGGSGCGRRIVRGGSWGDDVIDIHSFFRDWLPPRIRVFQLGFRLARDL
jgi:formylglycine-generating enzyme required for sulfatase activity